MKHPFNILEHPTGENIFNPTDNNKKDDKVRKCLKVVDFETTLHSVPESLYSFRYRFSQISVFYNEVLKKS